MATNKYHLYMTDIRRSERFLMMSGHGRDPRIFCGHKEVEEFIKSHGVPPSLWVAELLHQPGKSPYYIPHEGWRVCTPLGKTFPLTPSPGQIEDARRMALSALLSGGMREMTKQDYFGFAGAHPGSSICEWVGHTGWEWTAIATPMDVYLEDQDGKSCMEIHLYAVPGDWDGDTCSYRLTIPHMNIKVEDLN